MAKLITTYLIVLMGSAVGYLSDVYFLKKTKAIYYCDCSTHKINCPSAHIKFDEDLSTEIENYSPILIGRKSKSIIGLQ